MHVRSVVCMLAIMLVAVPAMTSADEVPAGDQLAQVGATFQVGAGAKVQNAKQAELEKAFGELLSGATLKGSFTVTGKDGAPKPEKYTLGKVTKGKGDNWVFQARIQYGDHDITLPLSLPVKWAGDTPVIVVDKLPFPPLGTFSARVMFYGNQYAGTWDGGDHGGQLFGEIVPAEKVEESK